MPRRRSSHELRCFCNRTPLLATYGIDEKGELYIHVRIFKQARVFGELIITGGTVKMRCRECLRWHTVVIRSKTTAVLVEDTDPPSLAVVP